MAAYLKQHDPYRHLVSTTYGDAGDLEDSDVDFTMTHMYGQAGNTADFTPADRARAHAQALAFGSLTCWPSSGSTGRPATSNGTRTGAA